MNGNGYEGFLNAAREAEKIILERPGTDDQDVAEGYLYLAGMMKFHLERVFTGFDLGRPRFVRNMDGFATWGLPVPDHHYLSAQIDGTGEYRISATGATRSTIGGSGSNRRKTGGYV